MQENITEHPARILPGINLKLHTLLSQDNNILQFKNKNTVQIRKVFGENIV